MKGWLLLVVLCLPVCSVFAAEVETGDKPAEPEETVVEEIIAKVNGRIITLRDLDRNREAYRIDLQRQNVPPSDIAKMMAEKEPHLLSDRIDTLLLLEHADYLQMSADDEVTRYIADLMLSTKIAEEDEFAQVVREQTGMLYEDFKEEVKNGFLTQRVLSSEVGSQIVIPQSEKQAYYEEHKQEFQREERIFLREILVSSAEIGDEAAKKKAEGIVQRARRGELFDEMAMAESDAQTAADGGFLTPFKKGELRAELEEQVWDAPRNHVTDAIKMDGGYLILKVIAHPQAGIAPFEEVQGEITNKLVTPLYQPKVREFLTKLRSEAFLEIKEGWVDTSAAPGKDTTWTDPAMLVPETIRAEEVRDNPGRKRLLWLIPIPGTQRSPKSSSR